MFHPEQKDALSRVISPSMTTYYFQKCHEDLRKKVMGSFDDRNVWSEKGYGNCKSFVGTVEIFSDKTATTLKNTALVVHQVHTILLNNFIRVRQRLMDILLTLVGFLRVYCSNKVLQDKGREEDDDMSVYVFRSSITV